MIENSDPACLVVEQQVLSSLPFKTLSEHGRRSGGARQVLLVDDLEYLYTEESSAPFAVPLAPAQLAYLMYTSGTTGASQRRGGVPW